ncbi:MAG: hypothetical protein AB7G75_24325, partial [Candidatus Binatia bacterium]
MKRWKAVHFVICAILILQLAFSVEARELLVHSRQTRNTRAQEAPPSSFPPISSFTGGFGVTITQQLSSNVSDFPAVSTAPGLTFRYDPATQLFERSTTSLGPVFVERARTIGHGKFEGGASYSYIVFTELDGRTVDGLFLPPRAGGSGGA